ncbi:potassium channel family protein [Frigidibacter sp. SD6-1]|uniref:potassium channel family protein n=1 Tax=Frigidibacter sp. SD6-1 TaxID=3032581 RepID=UPI0024E0119B|nr:potassium channel family protein [Frigidibacter sp. SD6-1]
MRRFLTELYERNTRRGVRFRYGLLAFDLVTIAFIVATSFVTRGIETEALDVVIGVIYLADVSARVYISRHRVRELLHPYGIADLVVVFSLLAPLVGEGFAFLRVARIFRVLRSYETLRRLRQDFRFFHDNEQTIIAATNLALFIYLMTALVYETQHRTNPDINNYVDALYFTVTTLTTTGYGDILMRGTTGRLMAVIIMICGISLFIRLVQVLLRPVKVEHKCPACGLKRHDPDAVHCKACGLLLHIEDEGRD